MKTIRVDDRNVALQLWDTAGKVSKDKLSYNKINFDN